MLFIRKVNLLICQTSIHNDFLRMPRFYKATIDKSKVPVISEDDLEEKFVRGSGPGGQNVNTASSACFLRHIPTGITVKCHELRFLEQNRKRARELLVEKLDDLLNGDQSVKSQQEEMKKVKALKREQKRRKRENLKKLFKEELKDTT